MVKKIISILLTMMMVFSAVPIFADEDTTSALSPMIDGAMYMTAGPQIMADAFYGAGPNIWGDDVLGSGYELSLIGNSQYGFNNPENLFAVNLKPISTGLKPDLLLTGLKAALSSSKVYDGVEFLDTESSFVPEFVGTTFDLSEYAPEMDGRTIPTYLLSAAQDSVVEPYNAAVVEPYNATVEAPEEADMVVNHNMVCQWTAITNELLAENEGVLSTGCYYLANDLQLTDYDITVAEGATVLLDLAGRALIGTGNDSVVYVPNCSSFILRDSYDHNTFHIFEQTEDGVFVPVYDTLQPGVQYYMVLGGFISGGIGHDTPYYDSMLRLGGAIYVGENSNFWMLSGKLIGNTAYNGGAILVDAMTNANILGGMILGNTATYGVVDCIHGSSLNVGGNTWITMNSANQGAGLYGMGDMSIRDNVVISNNTADISGGVCTYGDLVISGNPQIINNIAYEENAGIYAPYGLTFEAGNPIIADNYSNGKQSNLCLFGGYGLIKFAELIGKDAYIGVSNYDYSYETWTYDNCDGPVSEPAQVVRQGVFFSDDEDSYLYVNSELQLVLEKRVAQQPTIDDFTFEVNAKDCQNRVSYQWYKDDNGEVTKIKTPTSVKDLEDLCIYYCEATLGNGDVYISDKVCIHRHIDEVTGKEILFDRLITTFTTELRDGNYFLAEDTYIDDLIEVYGTVNLCLCGHAIVQQAPQNVFALDNCEESTFNIYDCNEDIPHVFEEDSETGMWYLSDGIDSNSSEVSYHTVYGGVITGGNPDFDITWRYDGGGIYSNCFESTINMYGGNIVGNQSSCGGGIFTLGNFNMYGGTIQGNLAGWEAGGVVVNGKLTVGGNAVIKNNKLVDSLEDCNLRVYEPICIAEGYYAPVLEGDDAMEIHINPRAQSPCILTEFSTCDISNNIYLDVEGLDVVSEKQGSKVQLSAKANFTVYLFADGTARANSVDGEDITDFVKEHFNFSYYSRWNLAYVEFETSCDYPVVICEDMEVYVGSDVILGGSKDLKDVDSYYGLVLLDGAKVTLRGYGNVYYNGELLLENGGRQSYDQCKKDTFCVLDEILDLNPNAWYHDGIHYVVENNLMRAPYDDEKGGDLFNPYNTVTREEVLDIFWELAGYEFAHVTLPFEILVRPAYEIIVEEGEYDTEYYYIDEYGTKYYVWEGYESEAEYDSPYDFMYTESARWAVENGLLDADLVDDWSPELELTREDVALMIYNYEKSCNDGGFKGVWMFNLTAKDKNKISSDCYEAMCWCVMKGIFQGSGNKLNPQAKITRAELATVLMRYFTLQ